MSDVNAIVLLTVALGAITTVFYLSKNQKGGNKNENFVETISSNFAKNVVGGFTKLAAKPNLWFVVDDFGTNSRRWVDFGARSSRDLNMGFLAVTKSRCLYTQGADFDVKECLGREAVAKIIYEHRGEVPEFHLSAPPKLWKAWARSALMYYVGGLYFDGLSLCLGPSFMSDITGKKDAVFGTEHDEPRTSSLDGSCSPFAGWASGPGHEAWLYLNRDLTDLIKAGPTSWTSAIARNQISSWYNKYLRNSMVTMRHSEWSRRTDGRPIEVEDLFGRSCSNLSNEWNPPENAVYVPLDYETIDRSVTYKWFLKLSAQDIISPESKFLWATLSQNIRH